MLYETFFTQQFKKVRFSNQYVVPPAYTFSHAWDSDEGGEESLVWPELAAVTFPVSSFCAGHNPSVSNTV